MRRVWQASWDKNFFDLYINPYKICSSIFVYMIIKLVAHREESAATILGSVDSNEVEISTIKISQKALL